MNKKILSIIFYASSATCFICTFSLVVLTQFLGIQTPELLLEIGIISLLYGAIGYVSGRLLLVKKK